MPATRARRRQQVGCPICGGVVSARVLDWHIAKHHDEGPAIALDPTAETGALPRTTPPTDPGDT